MFPIVPHQQSGVRFTISLHNDLEDVERLMEALAHEGPRPS
jgi:7-keto-8-aminopelargonate synthetase-like enzyme